MSKMTTETITRPRIAPRLDLTPPGLFNVIYVNDEVTTMEFVIESLKTIFEHSEDSATALTQKIHEEGSSVVATYPYELAEQRGVEATLLARNNGFPLAVKLEPSN